MLCQCPIAYCPTTYAQSCRCCRHSITYRSPWFSRFGVPDGAWQFFVAEGEPAGADYLFLGLLMASEDEADWNWVELPLSQLIMVPDVMLDDEFTPATFPDAVPFPYVD